MVPIGGVVATAHSQPFAVPTLTYLSRVAQTVVPRQLAWRSALISGLRR